jgi:hypothetical protein
MNILMNKSPNENYAKLKELFYDPTVGLSSKKELMKQAKDLKIDSKTARQFYDNQEINQIFKRKKPNYHKIIADRPFSWQADLMFFEQFKKYNDGFIGLFVMIEVTSKYLVCIPIKTKQASEITEAFKTAMNQAGEVDVLTIDEGVEFKKEFDKRLEESDIKVYRHNTSGGNKGPMMIVERVNRTIRDKLTKYMKVYSSFRWIDYINAMVDKYNKKIHSTTEMSPIEAFDRDVMETMIEDLHEERNEEPERENFTIGDKVRVMRKKGPFDKGMNRFSKVVYTITNITGNSYFVTNPKTNAETKQPYRDYQMMHFNESTERYEPDVMPEEPKPRMKTVKRKARKQRRIQKDLGYKKSEFDDQMNPVIAKKLLPKENKRERKQTNRLAF